MEQSASFCMHKLITYLKNAPMPIGLVRDCPMGPVKSVDKEISLADGVGYMHREALTFLPVVDERHRYAGSIDTHLLDTIQKLRHKVKVMSWQHFCQITKISTVMREPQLSITPQTPLKVAMALLLKENTWVLPVLSESGKLLKIITRDNISVYCQQLYAPCKMSWFTSFDLSA